MTRSASYTSLTDATQAEEPCPELPEDLKFWRAEKHVDPSGVANYVAHRAGLYSAAVVTESAHVWDMLVEKCRQREAEWAANPHNLPAGLRPLRQTRLT